MRRRFGDENRFNNPRFLQRWENAYQGRFPKDYLYVTFEAFKTGRSKTNKGISNMVETQGKSYQSELESQFSSKFGMTSKTLVARSIKEAEIFESFAELYRVLLSPEMKIEEYFDRFTDEFKKDQLTRINKIKNDLKGLNADDILDDLMKYRKLSADFGALSFLLTREKAKAVGNGVDLSQIQDSMDKFLETMPQLEALLMALAEVSGYDASDEIVGKALLELSGDLGTLKKIAEATSSDKSYSRHSEIDVSSSFVMGDKSAKTVKDLVKKLSSKNKTSVTTIKGDLSRLIKPLSGNDKFLSKGMEVFAGALVEVMLKDIVLEQDADPRAATQTTDIGTKNPSYFGPKKLQNSEGIGPRKSSYGDKTADIVITGKKNVNGVMEEVKFAVSAKAYRVSNMNVAHSTYALSRYIGMAMETGFTADQEKDLVNMFLIYLLGKEPVVEKCMSGSREATYLKKTRSSISFTDLMRGNNTFKDLTLRFYLKAVYEIFRKTEFILLSGVLVPAPILYEKTWKSLVKKSSDNNKFVEYFGVSKSITNSENISKQVLSQDHLKKTTLSVRKKMKDIEGDNVKTRLPELDTKFLSQRSRDLFYRTGGMKLTIKTPTMSFDELRASAQL